MRNIGFVSVVSVIFATGCDLGGSPAIQSVTALEDNEISIVYDPTQRTNAEMRDMARAECKTRGLELKDVTVAPTASPNTSNATVFCG